MNLCFGAFALSSLFQSVFHQSSLLKFTACIYQLQDWVVTFDVIIEIEHFGYGIQAEIFRIPKTSKTCKKIKMEQLYKQIEFVYKNDTSHNILLS